MNTSPPPFILCLVDQSAHHDDDQSEITLPNCISERPRSSNVGVELSADPYFYHTLGRMNGIHGEEALIELKLQVAKQQEKIDLLSSKLSKYQVENETLKAEKATLIDELVSTTSKEKTAARISISSKRVPLDTNEKLKNEIATLKVLDKVTKKSFQTFIKDSQRSSRQDKQTITKLQQENDALLLKLMSNPMKLSSCEGTAKTSLASFIDTIEVCQEDSSLYPSQDLGMFLELEVDSLEMSHNVKSTNKKAPNTRHSIYMPRNNRKSTVEADVTGVPRSRSAYVLVDFGETSQPYKSASNRQRHSIGN